MTTSRDLNRKVTSSLHALSAWDLGVAFTVAVLTAVISALFVAYDRGYEDGQDYVRALYSQAWASGSSFSRILNNWRISIVVALVISAIGLWSHKAIGFLFSALALMWIGLVYLWWYFDSLAYLRGAEISDYSQLNIPNYPHVGALRLARWWDVVVLVVAVAIFAWQVKTLISIFRTSDVSNTSY